MEENKPTKDMGMKCAECGLFNKTARCCTKYDTEINDPYINTNCKFYTQKRTRRSVRRAYGNSEFRNKKGREIIGGLMHTSPYWYGKHKNNKKQRKKKK